MPVNLRSACVKPGVSFVVRIQKHTASVPFKLCQCWLHFEVSACFFAYVLKLDMPGSSMPLRGQTHLSHLIHLIDVNFAPMSPLFCLSETIIQSEHQTSSERCGVLSDLVSHLVSQVATGYRLPAWTSLNSAKRQGSWLLCRCRITSTIAGGAVCRLANQLQTHDDGTADKDSQDICGILILHSAHFLEKSYMKTLLNLYSNYHGCLFCWLDKCLV